MLTIIRQHAQRRAIPLEISRHHTKINIRNQLATTKVDQVFTNRNGFPVDGMYIFPVPEDAVVSNLALSINGELVNGELLSQEESYRIYRESARHGENKAILEHVGTRAFVVKVPGIPANSKRRVQFEYSQVISADGDLAKYTYPLSLAKSASGLIGNLHVEMEIESDHELRAIHSPSYEVTIDRKNDHHVRVSHEGMDVDPDDDFLCYYSVSDENFGITLLTHRADEKEDGYFMLFVSPKYEVKQTEIVEKDFVFVLDRSGSMSGRKVEQAKEALRYCVQNLNDGDRFNLVLFNEDITSLADRLNRGEEWFGGERWPDSAVLSDKLIDVKDGREKAFGFIRGIEGSGMTNINDALLTALAEKPDPNRPRILVFLTDGQPTVGVRNPARILENVAKANRNLSRIFVFGVGYDVNDHLLDKMAADNSGTRHYVTPSENIEDAVSSLFRKMNEPVLVDVRINFGQITTKELTPKNLPDLFRGDQLTILGRYEGHGDTVLKLRGIIGSERHEFSKNVHFSELEPDNDFLPHLWAQGKIAELVDQAALGDRSDELYKEIKRLSEKYGIPTPYTLFVDTDDGSLRKVYDDSTLSDAYTEAIPIHERIRYNLELEERKYARHKRQYAGTKHVARKVFHRHGSMWIDSEYDGKSERKQVEFYSEDYYELMNHLPDLARYSKLAKDALVMIICYEGINYEITPPTA